KLLDLRAVVDAGGDEVAEAEEFPFDAVVEAAAQVIGHVGVVIAAAVGDHGAREHPLVLRHVDAWRFAGGDAVALAPVIEVDGPAERAGHGLEQVRLLGAIELGEDLRIAVELEHVVDAAVAVDVLELELRPVRALGMEGRAAQTNEEADLQAEAGADLP